MTDAISTGNYTSIDTETTGLSPWQNEVIEIGAVRFRDWQPVAEFDVLIRPEYPIPSFITGLTGITNEMVADKPRFGEIVEEFMDFLGDDDIVGHNISFDLKFLNAAGAPLMDADFTYHDTMLIGRKKLKKGVDIECHKLSVMCEYYGISNSNAHRAADDARATGKLFKKLINT